MTTNYLPHYPKYIFLDSMLKKASTRKMYIYVDLKNVFKSIYTEWASKEMLENTKKMRYIDLGLFTSFLEFIDFHKVYAKKKDVELRMCFFSERGKSQYHKEISNDYKSRRGITDILGLNTSDSDTYKTILKKNFDLMHNVGTRIPGVSLVRIDFIEADFIPHYAINHVLEDADDWAHVIYSNDKDMNQSLVNDHIFQFTKQGSKKRILDKKNAIGILLKDKSFNKLDNSWVAMVLAILGDNVDNVAGVSGIGPKTFIKIAEELENIFGSMNQIYKKLKNNEPLLDETMRTNNKHMQKIFDNIDQVESSLRLTSFEMLSHYINETPSISLNKIKKDIIKQINQDNPSLGRNGGTVLLEQFSKLGINLDIDDERVNNLFEG